MKIPWPFVPTPNEVKRSPAWRVRSLYAQRMIDALELEWSKSRGEKNGRLIVTNKDLLLHCCSANKNVLVDARCELVALGIVKFTPGKFGPNGVHEPNLWGLTYFPMTGLPGHNGGPAPHDWKQIKTVEEAKAIQAAAKKSRGQSDWLKAKQLAKEKPGDGPANANGYPNSRREHQGPNGRART